MRKLGLAPLVLFCIATSQAQTSPQPEAPPGVTVLKFSWHDLKPTGWDDPFNPAITTVQGQQGPLRDSIVSGVPMQANPPARPKRDQQTEVKRRSADPDIGTTQPSSSKKRDATRYSYQVKIKNVGEEPISGFDWEYLFVDSVQQTPLGRHRFLTFRRVAPGKSSTLESTSLAPPTRVINAARGKNPGKEFEERITVKCVAYSDGRVRWTTNGSERDCDALKREQSADRR
jgi:hypothetical protein